jgi:murein endopeptidase
VLNLRSVAVEFRSNPDGARITLLRGSERRQVGVTPAHSDVDLAGGDEDFQVVRREDCSRVADTLIADCGGKDFQFAPFSPRIGKLAVDARAHDGWPGLLVGDLSQPRGGPMVSSHASHQVGLDADIWFMPMPDQRLTEREREDLSAASMVTADAASVDPTKWTDAHVRVLKRAASYSSVERIFVHPAIKKAMCDAAGKDENRAWLHKIRAYWGHNDHFHVRIACPGGSNTCEHQPPLPADDGCGKELTNWLALVKPKPKPPTPPETVAKPASPKPGLTLDQLPAECRAVLAGGTDTPVMASKPATPPAAAAAKKPTTTTK